MTSQLPRQTVLVGVDGNAASAAAVRWAAAEAARRGARLLAVHVVDRSGRHDARLESDPLHELNEARQTIPGRVGDWIFRAGIEAELTVSVVSGDLVGQLVRHAGSACLVVVGAPDGPAREALPASLLARCSCPIVVVDVDGDVELAGVDNPHLEGAHHARA
jgi:nucleotide-binding universal stress UspA family protein